MSCVSLVALTRSCGQDAIMAGLENELYVVAHNDLDASTGSAFTTAVSGMISAITLKTGKKFVAVQHTRSGAGLTEKLTKNIENGTAYVEQTMELYLSDLTIENQAFVKSVLNQAVAVIVKTRTGKYFAVGLNGLFELASAEGGAGKKESDNAGYNLTFTGISPTFALQVDSTIISGLIS